MSYNIFLASDHHLGHANILTFNRNDGTPLRPYSSLEEMHEALVENHNRVVRPQDKVYMLGDVMMNKKGIPVLECMNGIKVLIKGNHDIMKLSEYQKHFKDVRSVWSLEKGYVLSHIPLHPDSLARWGTNIHGHLHADRVMKTESEWDDYSAKEWITKEIDTRYRCVCVEQIDYTPIAFEDLKAIIRKEQENVME